MQTRGSLLLIAATLCVLFSFAGRIGFQEPDPAFWFTSASGAAYVEFGAGFCPEGIHQIFDGDIRYVVKQMTVCSPGDHHLLEVLKKTPLQNGEKLEIMKNDAQVLYLKRSWMSAARRMTLGIALHPDRMMFNDWLDIQGIGPAMAKRIETDRQKNGNFGSPAGLKRVAGVGERRVNTYFPQLDND
jgi:competence protein ComEA